MNTKHIVGGVAGTVAAVLAIPASATVIYKDGDKYLGVGGQIQLQYHQVDPDAGASTDEVFFRRLRPHVEGSLHPDWMGKFQFDIGKASGTNEVAVKDAFLAYTGRKNMTVKIGNAEFPFSREFLTSSKKQQFVERTFVGDHDYGTPDRNTGVHVLGNTEDKKITWGASVASASIDPGNSKIDFDTPVNKDADFNEGWMIGGRMDFHPLGDLKFEQGDFSGDTKYTIGVAAFNWNNDDDNNLTAGSDVDSVTGVEISGAFRSNGWSFDAQYNSFDSELVATGVTSGLYRNSETTLENYAVKGGYMVIPATLELVAGFQSQDADNYAETWDRTSVGANWFLRKHDVKFQFTYQIGENLDGVKGSDADEAFVQANYVF